MNNDTRKKLFLLRLLIQFTIAFVLSLVMTAINHGFQNDFVWSWAKGFVVACVIIPFALRMIPLVAHGVTALMGNRSLWLLRCVVAICVAALMESIIALAVTLAQQGLASELPLMWLMTFIQALPLGLFIGFTMTFLVQPYMQKLALSNQVTGVKP